MNHARALSLLPISAVLLGGIAGWLTLAPAGALPGGQDAGSPPNRPQSPPAQGEVVPPHNYVGVAGCTARCHRTDRVGNQLAHWQESAHSHAYERLASEEARRIGTERGIANPQESPECLRCHTTAWGVPAANLGEGFDRAQGVQCEACHGPGADYAALRVMRNHDQAIANGLTIPNEQVCRRCHNEESPSYREFVFDERFARIAHPKPEGAPSGD